MSEELKAILDALAHERLSMSPDGTLTVSEANGFFTKWRKVGSLPTLLSALTASQARAEAAEARVGELEEALKPFAEFKTGWPDREDHYGVVRATSHTYQTLTVGDFHRAARTLKGTPDGR